MTAQEHKSHYGIDFKRPISELMTNARTSMTKLRGEIWDIRMRWPGLEGLQCLEGLLTCGICTLYYEIEQMKKAEARWAEKEKNDPLTNPERGDR